MLLSLLRVDKRAQRLRVSIQKGLNNHSRRWV